MFIRFYSKMLFPKGRNVIFPAIFLTGLSFIYATGHAPAAASENFTLVAAPGELQNEALEDLHIMIPYTDQPDKGLDGIEIQLPVMHVTPTNDGVYPINIRVKDPLWAMHDLADFSFSVKPGDSPTLWIDTRDRILPEGRALYISIAGADADLTPGLLNGTRGRIIYKSRQEARGEHEPDRFTQIRDLYAHIVEERPRAPRLNLYNRIIADCNDLLSVNPEHWLAQTYRFAATGSDKPAYQATKDSNTIESENGNTITFIGKNGSVLNTVSGKGATYNIKGDEFYVRAKITNSDGKAAWNQPVFIN